MPEEEVVKRRPGRPKGSGNKGSEKIGKGKLRDSLADSMTQKDIDKLPPTTKANLLAKLEPKPPTEAAQGTQVILVIRGLPGWKCFHCGQLQPDGYDPEKQAVSTGPVDAPGDSPPAEPPVRPAPPPDDSWKDRLPGGGKKEICPAFKDRQRGPADVNPPVEDDPPPPKGPVFRVPSIDDDGPPEWREPLFPKKES